MKIFDVRLKTIG